MQVILTGKSVKNRLVSVEVAWLINELKLRKSRADLEIIPKRNLIKTHGCRGLTGHLDDLIGLVYDSCISSVDLVRVIAHEMVHVKQLARGQLKYKIDGEDEVAIWRGKHFDLDGVKYIDRPWEVEAYSKQEILSRKFEDFVDDLNRMKKRDRDNTIRELQSKVS
jgi:hypothetical protein